MTDRQIRDEILAEFDYEPEVSPEHIGVSVDGGVVTRSGVVESYH